MAVLSQEEFLKAVNARVSEDSSDEAIQFVENMTDTYNSLAKQAEGDGENWEAKYNALDASWRKKYTQRFFSTGGGSARDGGSPEDAPVTPQNIKVEDLFSPTK